MTSIRIILVTTSVLAEIGGRETMRSYLLDQDKIVVLPYHYHCGEQKKVALSASVEMGMKNVDKDAVNTTIGHLCYLDA